MNDPIELDAFSKALIDKKEKKIRDLALYSQKSLIATGWDRLYLYRDLDKFESQDEEDLAYREVKNRHLFFIKQNDIRWINEKLEQYGLRVDVVYDGFGWVESACVYTYKKQAPKQKTESPKTYSLLGCIKYFIFGK